MTIRWAAGHLESDGEDIYYEVSGEDGDVVVLCHGLGGNHAVWFQQVPVLAERFRVVTWDQRSFGQSTNRSGVAGPAVAVADLGALLDHLGIDRAHLVGQSMGGWVVMGFALRSPERVRSLVVTDSPAGVYTDGVIRAMSSGQRGGGPEQVIGVHPAIGDATTSSDPVKAFLYQQIGSFRNGPDDVETIMGRIGATSWPVDEVAKLAVPTLLVTGAQDGLIPPAVMHELAKVIEGSHVVEIADAGHSPYFEQPDAWNEAVMDFLSAQTQE